MPTSGASAKSAPQPPQPLQLRDLGLKLHYRRPKLRILRDKLLIGPTTFDRHHTMIGSPAAEIKPTRRSRRNRLTSHTSNTGAVRPDQLRRWKVLHRSRVRTQIASRTVSFCSLF